PLTLDVEPGQFRELKPGEIAGLKRAGRGDKAQMPERKPPSRSKASVRRKEHHRERNSGR
ncbi:MAG TPA: hypothetical protein VGK21_16730, partial [Candidatus Angelobacter sp.]